jgi:ABC-type uncharacterized transport system ATPase subunit
VHQVSAIEQALVNKKNNSQSIVLVLYELDVLFTISVSSHSNLSKSF